jgi:hypothetical protein
MSQLSHFVSVTLLLAFFKVGMEAQVGCASFSATGCDAGARRVSEQPKGAIDGTNLVFSLSEIPAEARVSLFLNDHQLADGIDFRLKGKDLNLDPAWVPHVGDTLKATYQPQTTSPAPGTGVVLSLEKARELGRQALIESVGQETSPLAHSAPGIAAVRPQPAATDQGVGAAAGHVVRPDSTSPATVSRVQVPMSAQDSTPARRAASGPASISLLSRRIATWGKGPAAQWGKATSTYSGLEGVGDIPVTSPYAALLSDSPRSPRVQGTSSTQSVSPGLRSLSMLKERLDESYEAQRETVGEMKK